MLFWFYGVRVIMRIFLAQKAHVHAQISYFPSALQDVILVSWSACVCALSLLQVDALLALSVCLHAHCLWERM